MTSIKFKQEKQELESVENAAGIEYRPQRATYQFISSNNTQITMYIHDGIEHSPQEAAQHFKKSILYGVYAFKSSTAEVFIRENHDAVLIAQHDDYKDTSYKYDVTNSELNGVYTSEITAWTLENSDERKFYPIFKGTVEDFIREYE
tara:strand:- start:25 stop:465 length:441 start_codon:yes stop_codon:yes gene_type:complete